MRPAVLGAWPSCHLIAVDGPVGHATITAYGINGGQMGAQIGTATTDVNGNFSMAIGN